MSLQLILGCMFSGKSTELIRRIRRFESIGKKVCVINHNFDHRTNNKVETHYGDNVNAVKYVNLLNFVNTVDSNAYDVICIDEGQFFKDLAQGVQILVEVHRLDVVVSGLNSDFRRKRFGNMLDLCLITDDIHFCKAYCGKCKDGTLAVFTKRLTETETQVDIGANDKYIAVCRNCYFL